MYVLLFAADFGGCVLLCWVCIWLVICVLLGLVTLCAGFCGVVFGFDLFGVF